MTARRPRDAREAGPPASREAGLGERSDDLVLAVNEVLSNSLYHAHDSGLLRIWDEPDGLVCEVRDTGHILHPLIGREEPAIGQVGGHGIWLVNLVCDLVQVRSSENGSTVRMKMSPYGYARAVCPRTTLGPFAGATRPSSAGTSTTS